MGSNMNKILLILACFFAILSGVLLGVYKYQSKRIDTLQEAKITLQANNNLLINRLEKEHNDKVEVSRTNELLRKQIKADKTGFDWNYDLTSNPVLLEFKRMHSK